MLRLYLITALLHLYVGSRLLPALLPIGTLAVAALALWLVASAALIPFAFRARRTGVQRLSLALAWAGLIAMGSLSSLFVLTVIRDIALAGFLILSRYVSDGGLLQQFHDWSAAAVPILSGLFSGIGFINARRRAQVRSVDIPIVNLPASVHGFTIAQISDVHVGTTIKGDYLRAIVDAVNELNADMIAVTGDLVDGSVANLAPHTESLSRLSARYGAFFVTGNHEYYSGVRSWVTEIRRLGLHVLMNEHVVLKHEGAELVVAG